MRRLPIWLVVLALVAAACSSDQVAADSGAEALQVLFIGNSYTFGHDVPEVVETIAAANGVKIETEMYAVGGATLSDHRGDSDVRALISSGRFDFVVLQEQSQTPAVPQLFNQATVPAARDLSELARTAGAATLLFETWGHAQGSGATGHTSYGAMQQQIIASYGQLGVELGASVAPVGTAWREAMVSAPAIVLHDADNSHASPAGAYLAALVFADVFVTGPLTEAPDELVDSSTAAELLTVAALVDAN